MGGAGTQKALPSRRADSHMSPLARRDSAKELADGTLLSTQAQLVVVPQESFGTFGTGGECRLGMPICRGGGGTAVEVNISKLGV